MEPHSQHHGHPWHTHICSIKLHLAPIPTTHTSHQFAQSNSTYMQTPWQCSCNKHTHNTYMQTPWQCPCNKLCTLHPSMPVVDPKQGPRRAERVRYRISAKEDEWSDGMSMYAHITRRMVHVRIREFHTRYTCTYIYYFM